MILRCRRTTCGIPEAQSSTMAEGGDSSQASSAVKAQRCGPISIARISPSHSILVHSRTVKCWMRCHLRCGDGRSRAGTPPAGHRWQQARAPSKVSQMEPPQHATRWQARRVACEGKGEAAGWPHQVTGQGARYSSMEPVPPRTASATCIDSDRRVDRADAQASHRAQSRRSDRVPFPNSWRAGN